jgi:hypothetical protein
MGLADGRRAERGLEFAPAGRRAAIVASGTWAIPDAARLIVTAAEMRWR